MTKKSLFIFDVDGTLVDSYRAIERSLNFVRRQLGFRRISLARVKRNVGGGDKPFIDVFFPKDRAKLALKLYRRQHKKDLVQFARLRPEARKVLADLRQRRKRLAVASNRPFYFTRILLNQLRIAKYFDGVWCADKVKAPKPDPKILKSVLDHFSAKAKEAVYIGDMAIDLETARGAGIDAVFIRGGSSTLAEVKKYRHKKVILKLSSILKLYN